MKQPQALGFTLAELLVSLAILGIIAVFTVPKILSSQADARNNSMAKESAGAISNAYLMFKANNPGVLASINMITPYLNYVKADTTSIIDSFNTATSVDCSSASCLVMHNGSKVAYGDSVTFVGTTTSDAIYFYVDPDGVYSSTTNGPGKSVCFFMYYNGLLRTMQTIINPTREMFGSYGPTANSDPTWFSW